MNTFLCFILKVTQWRIELFFYGLRFPVTIDLCPKYHIVNTDLFIFQIMQLLFPHDRQGNRYVIAHPVLKTRPSLIALAAIPHTRNSYLSLYSWPHPLQGATRHQNCVTLARVILGRNIDFTLLIMYCKIK